MIVVRLARAGAKKHPFYHIVVTDSRRCRDSGYLEKLGYFNPFAAKEDTPVFLNRDRFDYWTSQGAKSSQRVSSIVSKLNKGKFAVKTETKKVEADELATSKDTENELLVEEKNLDAGTATGAEVKEPSKKENKESKETSSQTELELEKDTQGKKQLSSSETKTKSEDDDKVINEEPLVESPESLKEDKKIGDK